MHIAIHIPEKTGETGGCFFTIFLPGGSHSNTPGDTNNINNGSKLPENQTTILIFTATNPHFF